MSVDAAAVSPRWESSCVECQANLLELKLNGSFISDFFLKFPFNAILSKIILVKQELIVVYVSLSASSADQSLFF